MNKFVELLSYPVGALIGCILVEIFARNGILFMLCICCRCQL